MVVEPTLIRGELFGADRLSAHARQLAHGHQVASGRRRRWLEERGRGPLLSRLDRTEQLLSDVHGTLSRAAAAGLDVSPAGDWLLDNFFVVLEQVREIHAAMPRGYYHELPKLAAGRLAGYPRIYAILIELIAHTDGRLDAPGVELMIREYQTVAPLTLGELWAIPAMLRMGFLENIRRMALRASRDVADREAADGWVARLLDAPSAAALRMALREFVRRPPELTPAFLTRFVQQIRSRGSDFTPLLWLEQWVAEDAMTIEEAAQRTTQELALTQLVMANSITSLRTVGSIDWQAFVEDASATEAVLRGDPPGVYVTMTRATRDRYRHVVENLGKRTVHGELAVASAAVGAAAAGAMASGLDAPHAHVGYYLVGDGRRAFARSLGYRAPLSDWLTDWTLVHPGPVFFGALAITTAALVAVFVSPLGRAGWPWALAALCLALLPAADAAVAIVNQLVMLVVPPSRLGCLDFQRAVPERARTVVVVPLLLGSAAAVHEALDHLEAQYLANRDPQIRFAMLGDFMDADQETTPDDDAIVTAAVDGIRALNHEHGGGAARALEDGDADADPPTMPFYLLHRRRQWNAADSVWMGWERKRGKLVDFNALASGVDEHPFSVFEGELGWLLGVRYVITLDADTVLPRGAAAALIGTIAHPLNRAVYDASRARVVRGYGILQPRVSVSLSSANSSRFASIYAGHPGVDPYTTAVSDVYQDLFGEGTFTGKGIYDLDIFRRATAGRFPDNALLSHDLIEGTFARAGLVTDIEVFDDYPARYLTHTRRLHRWIRGDWQLLPWLRRRVPGPQGATPNPLTALSRWKMLDNMRRSATPILLLAWLVAGWTILPGPGIAWTVAASLALGIPYLAAVSVAAVRPPREQSWRPYYAALGHDAWDAVIQLALAVVLLPDQVIVAADAIGRSLVRVLGTRRNMLEWQTARQVERATGQGRRSIWRRMWPSVALALCIVIAVAWSAPRHVSHPMPEWVIATALTVLAACWVGAPEVALALSSPLIHADLALDPEERAIALRYAERHWRYFDRFVTADTHWLVPDNFQETPEPIVASRTSPTNIGLQLLATVSACHLGFLTTCAMVDRLERIFDTLDTMTRVRGHFLNWYDIADLRVLDPPYVSTVDSGNLAGHLVALAEACRALAVPDASNTNTALVTRLDVIARRAREMAMEMDFQLLYEPQRRLFAIGYDARTGRLDDGSYDLLASESRLGSYMAVAKGDVRAEHWFRLGRSLTTADGATALVSWSGSMFEYLMPLLVMPSRPFSLLDQTCQAAVRRQIAYGRARHVPWGFSECAYNLRDRHGTYQYRGFGVPDLALKRGLAGELVVAPYATALAAGVEPHDALLNLAELERLGTFGEYGFYDAVDFTRVAPGETAAVVRTYMAHHIGMSLVALDNAISVTPGVREGVWQRRFMADAAVRAAALLLDERVPRRYVAQPPQTDAPESFVSRPAWGHSLVHEVDTPNTTEPHVALLGGLGYSVLITNAGSGYSRANGMDVLRWRADATEDDTGQWIYVKDLSTGATWSATYQPTRVSASVYRVAFATDRVVFTRRDGAIETRTEMVVIPSEQAEVRRVTLINRSRTARDVELTSYGEVVLCDADADRAHQAFQKLFVETECVAACDALLASRRPRAADEPRPWCMHVVATGEERVGTVTYETDRARFLGRGRTVHTPRALDPGAVLSGTVGAVLDPIVALRVRVHLEAGRSTRVAFTTAVAAAREAAIQLADRYRDLGAAERALTLAGIEAHVEMRDLRVDAADVALYQELAGALIYPHDALRAPDEVRAANRLGQSALWAQGISGDWPIVLATIHADVGLSTVRQLLAAHAYWRMRGVRSDLVILNAQRHSYAQELHDQLMAMVMSSGEGGLLDRPGGVFMRRSEQLSADDAGLLVATARINVVCDGVGLGEIIAAHLTQHALRLHPAASSAESPHAADDAPVPNRAARQAPSYENGHGALTARGDYAITVSGTRVPPAPWANVIANPAAGCCITERGGGFTWVENSYFFRLTPWFNDPVSDPCGDVLYLRDAQSGRTWTPTPGPFPALGDSRDAPEYEVRHAPGTTTFSHERDGLATELIVGMPPADPVRIQRLRIANRSSVSRRVVLTSYVEWALGAQREHTRHQVHTKYDRASGALFAQNFFAPDFTTRVAFSWISEQVSSHTSRRDHFIGRNGDLTVPAALKDEQLSGESGAGYDPCAALRCTIALAPGERRDVIVLLGAASSEEDARALIARHGTVASASRAIADAASAWDDRLSVISAHTPDSEFDALLNRWSLYQALSCRMWARSALYQSSGAYGFRDQLQDSMAFVYAAPAVARAHLLRCAGRQFVEGDVQHWWHEPGGRGVRTRSSDDLVWLPFVADRYITATGDTGVLDAPAPYLTMRVLAPGEQEAYELPAATGETGSLYDHCVRALDRACTLGPHGLPLMGSGDWNDGMNRVGVHGIGESVWVAWFLATTLRRFAVHAHARGDTTAAERFVASAEGYVAAIERDGWDGAWYRRAYFDDGSPLGAAPNEECQIDAIAQSWAVLCGAGDPERARTAMRAVNERLVRDDARLVLLLTPPFDHSSHDPGYIKGYVPGVRENGAQYTHAALWTALAMVKLGDGDRAGALMRMLNPFTHARTPEQVETYKVEPYVVCADVYAAPSHVGQGGWTWYTGSASWSYRVALEGVIGFEKRGQRLTFDPCVPSAWPEATVQYRYGSTQYMIVIRNPDGVCRGVRSVEVDGALRDDKWILLSDDGAAHSVIVTLGVGDVA